MDRTEYDIAKQKLIETFGQPEWDNHVAVNESAKRLNTLLTEYRLSCRAAKRLEAKEAGQKQETEIKDLITPEIKQKYKGISIGAIELNENDLLMFTDVEKDIIHNHFEDMTLTHKQLAFKNGVSRQIVTALLDSPAYRFLETKVFSKLMPSEIQIALLKATRGGDSKIVQRLAEHYKILHPEKLEVDINKPIEDSKAVQMLKELGDRLVNEAE
jgi:hypothetical protein